MQGWRRNNEDTHITKLSISNNNSLFVVFDGHGGQRVSQLCEAHFEETLVNLDSYKNENYTQALLEAFVEIDYMVISKKGHEVF